MKNFKIIDFDKKYSDDIFKMESSQWGVWGDEAKINSVQKNEIIRIALYENKFAGIVRGFNEKDFFKVYIICILPEYQKKGFGTLMLKDFLEKAKEKFNPKLFTTEIISVLGHANSKKLFENFGFKLAKEYKGYWGKQFPNVFCTECNRKPCICDALIYELKVE